MQIDRSCWLPNKQGAFGRLDGGIINFYYYFHQYLSLTFVGHLPCQAVCEGADIHHGITSLQQICGVSSIISPMLETKTARSSDLSHLPKAMSW